MPIANVILFISSASRESMPCLNFVEQHQLPVRIIRLDTQQDRMRAANGRMFQITGVPTLLLIYEDQNIQLYAGKDKIMGWFSDLVNRPSPPPYPHYEEPAYPKKGKSRPKKKSKKKKKVSKVTLPEEPRIKGLYGTKKKSPPIEFASSSEESENSEDENPIEYLEPPPKPHPSRSPRRPPGKSPKQNPQTSGLMVGPAASRGPSKTSSIYEMARQMEKDMHATRGWKEEDLPVSS